MYITTSIVVQVAVACSFGGKSASLDSVHYPGVGQSNKALVFLCLTGTVLRPNKFARSQDAERLLRLS